MSKLKIKTRGGARKGSGRKSTGKITLQSRVLPQHVAAVKDFILRLPALPGS